MWTFWDLWTLLKFMKFSYFVNIIYIPQKFQIRDFFKSLHFKSVRTFPNSWSFYKYANFFPIRQLVWNSSNFPKSMKFSSKLLICFSYPWTFLNSWTIFQYTNIFLKYMYISLFLRSLNFFKKLRINTKTCRFSTWKIGQPLTITNEK